MIDPVDLMNPEAISRLRHSLRTPLNHIIGYAEMVRDEAYDQSATDEAALMEDVAEEARRIVEMVEEALPVRSHVGEGSIPRLRAGMKGSIQRITETAARFEKLAGSACSEEIGKIRDAVRELEAFAHARRPRSPQTAKPNPIVTPPPKTAGRPTPITTPPPERAEVPGPIVAAPLHERSRVGRVLVVDDDADNREILERRLEREGFQAEAEPDGAAALARLRRERFDLVLLDIFMPGMDGFHVLAEMKGSADLRDVPVIVLSAADDYANAVRSIEMGAEDFLAKPFDPVLLRARIGAVLRRRRAEVERAQIAESLELLLESTGEGIYGIDLQGDCIFVNRAAAEMLGRTRDELLGRGPHELIHHTRADGSPYPSAECPMLAVMRTGEPRRGRDELLFRADGSSFPVEFSAHPILRNGHAAGVVVVFTDIAEKKRTEEHLLQAAKLESVGVLAGGIAHDFNNILTGILGNTTLVLDALPPADHNNRDLLAEVVRSSERAAGLTRQMLAFAGKGQFVIEPVDLSQAIGDVAELLTAALPKSVALRLELAGGLPRLDADARQIQELVFSLVINAGEAIGDGGGEVRVETGVRESASPLACEPPFGEIAPGRYLYLAVQDNGHGMDPATRARIFDPFFSTKFAGRGLGLAAAMGIVRSHRGAMRVESEPGKGSRFEILFQDPRKDGAGPAAGSREAATATPEAASQARTILVVDDEEIVRRTTSAMLSRKGYRVLLAENGQEAVTLFRDRGAEISLVLLDLTMPLMGGEEAARYLRAIRHDVPILVSSGYPETEVARRFAGIRVKGFVRKPYTSAGLLQKVNEALPDGQK